MNVKDKKTLAIVCGGFLVVLALVFFLLLQKNNEILSNTGKVNASNTPQEVNPNSNEKEEEVDPPSLGDSLENCATRETNCISIGKVNYNGACYTASHNVTEEICRSDYSGTYDLSTGTCYYNRSEYVYKCEVCNQGYYFPEGVSTCTICPAGSYCNTGTDVKMCPIGYRQSEEGSTKLADCYASTEDTKGNKLTYDSVNGRGLISGCDSGYYSVGKKVTYGNSYSCTKAPANSTIINDRTYFKCNDGYTLKDGECISPKINCTEKVEVGKTVSCTITNGTLDEIQTGSVQVTQPGIASVQSVTSTSFTIKGEESGTTAFKATISGVTVTSNNVTVYNPRIPTLSCTATILVGKSGTCTISNGTLVGNIRVGSADVASVGTISGNSFTITGLKYGTTTFVANVRKADENTNVDVTSNLVVVNNDFDIFGHNLIAIAEDVGTVTGSYSATQNDSPLAVNWSASGSGATFTGCSNAVTCNVTYSHQGTNGTSPKRTTATVRGTMGTSKDYEVTVISYCSWKLVNTHAGGFTSASPNGIKTRPLMRFIEGCKAYENMSIESDGKYYGYEYDRCCGSSSVDLEYCYINRTVGENEYCYGTASHCNGFVEKVPTVSSASQCTETPACYQKTDGSYVSGKYSGKTGYTKVDSSKCTPVPVTPPSDDEVAACYKNKTTGKYEIGKFKNNSNYEYVGKTCPSDDEVAACYKNKTTGKYEIGKFKNNSNYEYVGKTCPSTPPENNEKACYKKPDGEYVWDYPQDGYVLYAQAASIEDCPPKGKCYVKDGDYKVSTTDLTSSGYTALFDITSTEDAEKCHGDEPPAEACYLFNNKHYWGSYGNNVGYVLIDGVDEEHCVDTTEACYLTPENKTVWGKYKDGYKLIPNVDEEHCKEPSIPDVPKTALNVPTLVIIAVAAFAVAGFVVLKQVNYGKEN